MGVRSRRVVRENAGNSIKNGSIPIARKLLGTISFVASAVGNSITSDQLECNDIVPPTKKGGLFGTTVHEFVQFDCCCLLRETQWLANDIKSPKSCSEVCKARGLECGSHDRCRDIPSLCSKSFPEFFVQSMATYGEDPKTGKGMLTFPTCDEVPATNRLESHGCVCL